MALSSLLSILIRCLAKDEEKLFRGEQVCQEIMAPQVEHDEETLLPSGADETQQQPAESHLCLSRRLAQMHGVCLSAAIA